MIGRELPAGWQTVRIADVCEINPKHAADSDRSAQVSFVPMPAVSDVDGRILKHESRPLSQVWTGYTHFAEDDVIFAKITPCMENGKSAVARGLTNGKACGSTEFFVLRSTGAIIPDYLHRYIRQASYRHEAEVSMTGAVGQKRVPRAFVEESAVPLPPIPEQRRIVEKIEALTARSRRAREALDALPALIDRYRQSILAAAFRGDLTAEWRRSHQLSKTGGELLGQFLVERARRTAGGGSRKSQRCVVAEPAIPSKIDLPSTWAWASLDQISWARGYGTSAKCDYSFQGVGVLRIPNVARGAVNIADLKFVADDSKIDPDQYLTPGDLVVVRTNGSKDLLGRGAVVQAELQQPLYFASYIIRFRLVGSDLLHRWIHLMWQSPDIRSQIISYAATSAGQYNVSMGELSTFALPIPPAEEMVIACTMLERGLKAAEELEGRTEAASAAHSSLDQSILAKAFRGELVPQDPNDEPASVLLERIRAERAAAGTGGARRGRPRKAG